MKTYIIKTNKEGTQEPIYSYSLFTLPLFTGFDYIRFLTLGANGVPTNFIARSTRIDDISSPIYIPFGLPFGESIQRTAYVCMDTKDIAIWDGVACFSAYPPVLW